MMMCVVDLLLLLLFSRYFGVAFENNKMMDMPARSSQHMTTNETRDATAAVTVAVSSFVPLLSGDGKTQMN
jgi:hypothetical protein